MNSLAEMLFLQSQAQGQQSPVQRGAEAGIQAAQNSIAMSEMQKRRAEGQAMMQVTQHLYRPEYGRGLRGALAGFGAGIEPATQAYLGAEDTARAENMKLLERQDALRQHAEKQALELKKFDETKRYHDLAIAEQRARTNAKSGSSGLTKNEHTMYSKQYKSNREALKKISSIENDLVVFKKETEKNAFAPFGSSLGKYPNIAKEELSKIGSAIAPGKDWVKSLNIEYKLKNSLFSKMKLLEPIIERASKGGQPDVSLMNRFEKLKVLFSADQPLEVLEEKFKEIKKDVEENMLEAENVLKTGDIFAGQVEVKPNTEQYGFKPVNKMTPEEIMAELKLIEQEENAGQ